MIDKLEGNYGKNNRDICNTQLFDKINEIIDFLNKDQLEILQKIKPENNNEINPIEYDKQGKNECIDCSCYNSVICESCQEQDKFKPIQKLKQSWKKKLEEVENYYNKCDKINAEQCKRFGYIRANTEFDKLNDLYKQVISELIKDNEELEDLRFKYRKLINESEDQARQNIYKMKLKEKEINDLKQQLQQKQPDKKIIFVIGYIIKSLEENGQYAPLNKKGVIDNLNKLLKYLKNE